jgi:hypothetical protein
MFKKAPAPRPKIKVRIKRPIAGNAEPIYDLPDFGFAPGQVVELDQRLAESWIASGVAEAVQ